jgi:zinc and cadmium transporter
MNMSFIFMILSALALPALAFLTLLLRRNTLKGRLKLIFLILGLLLLALAVFTTFTEREEISWPDFLVAVITAGITLFILSRFNHNHSHAVKEGGAQGIVISEAFHSLLDGAVIGATYIVSPILGYAATVGIITHELPKILGTLTLFRGLGFSVKKTIFYGFIAQIGSPVAALLVYILGKEFNHEQFHSLEVASISSLAAIVLWIIYLEIRFHIQHDSHKKEKHPHAH